MTITTDKPKTTRRTRKATKPRRDVGESGLPVNTKGDLDMVAVLTEALTVPGRLSQCYNKFHRYSFLNIVLVYMQTGKLEPMATFNRWKTLDRNVIKGNKALFINHPKFAPHRDSDGNVIVAANGKPEMKVVGFYPKATVFQLFQTEGQELIMPDMPEWDRVQAAEHLDLTEEPFSHNDGNVQGYSIERRYAINPVAEQPFKTLIHEWAHILLGHTAADTAGAYHRGVCEFQAEAVALLVCTELDLPGYDPATSRGYIQNWLHGDSSDYLDDDGNLLIDNKTVRQVFSTVDAILTAGRVKHYNKLAAASDK